MRRFIAFIIAISFFCASTGFTLHTHYCMGNRISTSLEKTGENHKCSHCGMIKKSDKNGCCKDEQQTIKADIEAAFAKSISSPSFINGSLPLSFHSLFLGSEPVAYSSSAALDLHHLQKPPTISKLRLHARNCVFLI